MGLIVLIGIVIVAVAVAALVLVLSRRRSSPPAPPTPAAPPRTEVAPMTGLEEALAHVTDSSGRPIQAAIDAEQEHVDELRVPDDTGPLLRRALDHVAPDESDD